MVSSKNVKDKDCFGVYRGDDGRIMLFCPGKYSMSIGDELPESGSLGNDVDSVGSLDSIESVCKVLRSEVFNSLLVSLVESIVEERIEKVLKATEISDMSSDSLKVTIDDATLLKLKDMLLNKKDSSD